MKLKICFLVALVVCILKIEKTHSLQTDDMDTYKTRIDVKDPSWGSFSSGILKSHSGLSYTPNRRKELIISAPPGYSIFAAVRLLDFRPNNQDHLTLYANDTVKTLFYSNSHSYRKRQYDSSEENYVFLANNGQLGVRFDTGPGYTTYGYDGFELIYTVQSNWTACKSSYFRCKNKRCISNSLTCDGHNHCGDGSDQRNCYIAPGSGKKIGIGVGAIFLVIAVVCGIYIVIRRATRSRTEVRTIINHPPEATVPGYTQPPAYPQTQYYPPPPPPYSNYNQGANNPGFR